MFYQVYVDKESRDFLRFLWWPGGDLDAAPVTYRMVVHLFGAASSPSCSIAALQQTAKDNKDDFDATTCDAIMNNFYVDDLLKSVATEREAVVFAEGVTTLCQKGGFRLTKWASNNRTVLESVPPEEQTKDIQELDLDCDDLPMERVLGVSWFVETDTMGFKISIREAKPTRRNLLSIVSSVFDPLGLAAPFILPAKILLQDLCRRNIGWDEQISGKDLTRWNKWLAELPQLEHLSFRRCFKPESFRKIADCQLHYFVDASEAGYGMVCYLRLTDDIGRTCCCLLMGRSRVTPLKKVTVPRLELTAAAVAVRFHIFLTRQLEYAVDAVYFWTDSMAVIRYIKNENTRFSTFVANRLTLIREGSDGCHWRHIGTNDNPADDASRGLTFQDSTRIERWVDGPPFLLESEQHWPPNPDDQKLDPEDPEVKPMVNVSLEQNENAMDKLLSHYSDWRRLKRAVSWIKLAMAGMSFWAKKRKEIMASMESQDEQETQQKITRLKESARSQSQQMVKSLRLSSSMMNEAEECILRYTQKQNFAKEIEILAAEQTVTRYLRRSSSLFKLDPFLEDGLVRVGGRLDRAALPYEARHPIVLPRNNHVSRLIIDDVHQTIGHLGRNYILAQLRQRYWIIGSGASVKQMLSRCVTCRRYQARAGKQKMANLPEDRLRYDEPPFTRVGVDYFGPIDVKRGRSSVKRYGVIFTCLSCRAVHLEMAFSLDTDSCINAIRRFVARRGVVKLIRSDNGTNLVGAQRELREEIDRWDQDKIHQTLQNKGITWEFNPPSGSHFGGVWERLIRTVRKIMFSLLHQQSKSLNDEGLSTLFCEVEAILNGRPLTRVSPDQNDLEVLTPNHILLLRSGESMPCGMFDKEDIYAKRRWRQVQYLANIFWKRWIKEYLPLLQERQKWLVPHRNVQIGDIVLVVENTPRNSWSMGKVIDVITDKHGHVRIADVKTKSSVLQRPIDKLCLLMESENSVSA